MDDPYSFKENEGKRPEEVHFNLEGKHLNYLFYPLQIVRNCDGYSGRPQRKDENSIAQFSVHIILFALYIVQIKNGFEFK